MTKERLSQIQMRLSASKSNIPGRLGICTMHTDPIGLHPVDGYVNVNPNCAIDNFASLVVGANLMTPVSRGFGKIGSMSLGRGTSTIPFNVVGINSSCCGICQLECNSRDLSLPQN